MLPNNVSKQVKQIDTTRSGSGNIPTKIIKDSIDVYVNQLTYCLNASIYDCSFPKTMKFGDVTPVFKKDEKVLKENYRPICDRSPLSKVLFE